MFYVGLRNFCNGPPCLFAVWLVPYQMMKTSHWLFEMRGKERCHEATYILIHMYIRVHITWLNYHLPVITYKFTVCNKCNESIHAFSIHKYSLNMYIFRGYICIMYTYISYIKLYVINSKLSKYNVR